MNQISSSKTPWGTWRVLLSEPGYQVKRLSVLPGKRLSYQAHARRSEHWVIVQGKALATLDGEQIPLDVGECLEVPISAAHRIANPGLVEMVFIEIQRGSYLGEDDITRLEDDYGRAEKTS